MAPGLDNTEGMDTHEVQAKGSWVAQRQVTAEWDGYTHLLPSVPRTELGKQDGIRVN